MITAAATDFRLSAVCAPAPRWLGVGGAFVLRWSAFVFTGRNSSQQELGRNREIGGAASERGALTYGQQGLGLSNPLPSPASIPSAVDPHTVEQAWFRGVKVERATVRTTLTPLGRVCSALPGSTVDGMGAPHARPTRPAPASGAPSIPESERPRRRHVFDRGCVRTVIATHQTGLSTRGRASAAAAPSGPKAGARAQPEPGARPAERSAAGLDEVEKPVTGTWHDLTRGRLLDDPGLVGG